MAKTLPKHRPKLTIRKPTTCGHTFKNITQNRPFGSPLHVAKTLPKHRPKPAYSEAHYVWPVFQKHRPKPAYSEAHYAWPVFQKHRPKPTVRKPTTCGQNASKTSPKTCLFGSSLRVASLPKTSPKTCLFGSPLRVASLPKTSPKTDHSEAHYVWPKRFQKHRPKLTVQKPTMCGQNTSKTSPKTDHSEAHYVWPHFQKYRPKLTIWKPTTCGQNASKTSPKTCLFGSPLHVASLPKTLPKTDCSEAHYVWPKCFQNVTQNRQFRSPLHVAKTLPKRRPKPPIWKPTMCGQNPFKTSPKTANSEAHYM